MNTKFPRQFTTLSTRLWLLSAGMACLWTTTAFADQEETDFGDYRRFPGASSRIDALSLGDKVDEETGVPSTDPLTGLTTIVNPAANDIATGDDLGDNDDEDGAIVPARLIQGETVTIPVNVNNDTEANAYLNAWLDFDNNGVLDNTVVNATGGEKLTAEIVIPPGFESIKNITFTVPSGAPAGYNRGVRFRLTSVSNPGPDGADGFGEVEDYVVRIIPPGFVYAVSAGRIYEVALATGRATLATVMAKGFTGPGNAVAFTDTIGLDGVVIYSNGMTNDCRLAVWDRATGMNNIAGNLALFGMPASSVLRTGAFYGGYYWTIPDNTDDLWKVQITGVPGAYTVVAASKVSDLWLNQRDHVYGDMIIKENGIALAIARRNGTGLAEYYTADLNQAIPAAVQLGAPPIFQNSLGLGLNGILYSGLGLSSNNTEWYVLDPNNGSIIQTTPRSNLSSVSDMSLAATDPSPVITQTHDYGDSSMLPEAGSLNSPALVMGTLVDSEAYANTTALATGDDLTRFDDEDGVTAPAYLQQGQTGATITVKATNTTGVTAFLNVWLDFNRDRDLIDAGEQIATDLPIPTGTVAADTVITFSVPLKAANGTVPLRVRLTSVSNPGGEGIDGTGEVEDLVIEVTRPPKLNASLQVSPAGSNAWSPAVAVEAGLAADYRLTLSNTGPVPLRDPMAMELLPAPGDTGTLNLTPRASAWKTTLKGPASIPAGMRVAYSLEQNPQRPELLTANPLGSLPPGWSLTIADFRGVRALKFDGTGLTLAPAESLTITWSVDVPWDATALSTAVNSVGVKAVDALSGLPMAPFESGLATIQALPPMGELYGDKVWNDANEDGLQSPGETGVNGVLVRFFRDNGDDLADPVTDTMVAETSTSDFNGQPGYYRFRNFPPGKYFAVVEPDDSWGLSPVGAGIDPGANSDASLIVRNTRRTGVMPVTQIDPGEQDLTWDAGLSSRAGIPAVWAITQTMDNRYVIGGKFNKSHGVPRRNIAVLTSGGAVDTSFDPGIGFDDTVRSVAILSNGMILAGGNFSNYNGFPGYGVALLSPTGARMGPLVQPNTREVHWVGTDGTRMYIAGAFSSVGGVPAGNIARLTSTGLVDTSFRTSPGANGPVYCGVILPTGIVIAGAFTEYGGQPRRGIAKIKSDGSLEASFDPRGGAAGEVYSLKLHEDGRMVLTGNFRSFDGVPCNGNIRIDQQGVVDPACRASALSVQSINSAH